MAVQEPMVQVGFEGRTYSIPKSVSEANASLSVIPQRRLSASRNWKENAYLKNTFWFGPFKPHKMIPWSD